VWGIKNKIIKNDLIVCRKVLDISWYALILGWRTDARSSAEHSCILFLFSDLCRSGDSERLIAAGDGSDV